MFPGKGAEVREQRWNWIWGVIQNQGWTILKPVGNSGSKGAKVRVVVDAEKIKNLILDGIINSYPTTTTAGGRTLFDEAQEKIRALARGNNEIAAYRNEVARMTRADGVLNGGNGG